MWGSRKPTGSGKGRRPTAPAEAARPSRPKTIPLSPAPPEQGNRRVTPPGQEPLDHPRRRASDHEPIPHDIDRPDEEAQAKLREIEAHLDDVLSFDDPLPPPNPMLAAPVDDGLDLSHCPHCRAALGSPDEDDAMIDGNICPYCLLRVDQGLPRIDQ